MLTFSSSYTLSISDENLPLKMIVAKEFGWIEGMDLTPEQVIENHFLDFYEKTRQRIELGLLRMKGEANKAEVDAIMQVYNDNVITSAIFTDEN